MQKSARAMYRGGLISLDHALRDSQNVEFGLVFVLNRVEEVKSTYIEIAAYLAESFLFLTRRSVGPKVVFCETKRTNSGRERVKKHKNIFFSFHYNSEHLSSLVTK